MYLFTCCGSCTGSELLSPNSSKREMISPQTIQREGRMRQSDLTFYPFVCVVLTLLRLRLQRMWGGGKITPTAPKPPKPKREPKPFAG